MVKKFLSGCKNLDNQEWLDKPKSVNPELGLQATRFTIQCCFSPSKLCQKLSI